MSLRDYLKVFRERWLVLAVAVTVAVLAAGGTWLLTPKEYTARLTLYVAAQSGDDAATAYQGSLLSQQRVTSYVELVSSTRVSSEVIVELGLRTTPESLARRISASNTIESVLIDVAVTDTSPQRAADIANAVGGVFSGLVTELERPASPGAVPPVAVRVVQEAAVPVAPSSLGLPVTLVLGLLAGLGVGVAGALVRNALDTSVTSPEQLRELATAPNLGVIAFDTDAAKRPLTIHDDPQSPRAEAFRQLRTNLQFVDVDTPRKVVAVTSSLPGEGKTTTAANLALALASAGRRVLVVEADLRRPRLADLFGLERAVGLTSVLAGRVRLEQAVQQWSPWVDVLASGPLPPNPSELLSSRHMSALLAELRGQYDTVLVDTPPLLPVTDAAAVAPATDGVVLVCRFTKTSRDQVRAAADALRAVSAPLLGTVFTMVPKSGPRTYGTYHSYHRTDQPVVPASPALGTPSVRPPRPRLDGNGRGGRPRQTTSTSARRAR